MSLTKIKIVNDAFTVPVSFFPSRKRRQWVSFITSGCYNDSYVYQIWRAPVSDGVAHIHLAWQHRIVQA